MAKILGVGIATLDIINSVSHYPTEDEELRASAQRICRGGNATNSLSVLSQYGHQCYWTGVLCNENDANYILDDLNKNKINFNYCQQLSTGKVPTSYITLNLQTGSRTIVHYRDLPELTFDFFQSIPLHGFDWVHFEARDVKENVKMIQWLKENFPDKPVSVEIEKSREGIEKIFSVADLYLFSKNYANNCGFDSGKKFLQQQARLQPGKDLVCAWGEQGAYALTGTSQFIHQSAFTLDKVVDTLGAGDTFNAGIIHARLSNLSWEKSLESACHLAAKKCTQEGFASLV